ncbi:hypothetical protein OUZ56_016691 [Daphnia magna]|uniref:BED-type domain-containing protein n=1 Tax=Daphnia magna TaxID=35525 RepID=A0ABR0ARA2_9CRUS|nr:hypothetical protein OUZ56_016691 [Daphnia magna]
MSPPSAARGKSVRGGQTGRSRGRPPKVLAGQKTVPSPTVDEELGHVHEEMLLEEAQMIEDESNVTSIQPDATLEGTAASSHQSQANPQPALQVTTKPPDGTKVISAIKMALWPSWRKKMFEDWRESRDGKVYAFCEKCNTYYSGTWHAFSNISLHASRVHTEDYNRLMAFPASNSSGQQSSITKFTAELKIPVVRQAKLDQLLTRAFATGNIPLYFLQNEDLKAF